MVPTSTLPRRPSPVAAPWAQGKLAEFLPWLACPTCRGRLEPGEEKLACRDNDHEFEFLGDIPILLDAGERATLGVDYEEASLMQMEYGRSFMAATKRLVKKLIGSNLYLEKSQKTLGTMAELEAEWWLEIGSGIKASGPRRINMDIRAFTGVDVVGSGLRLPFTDNSFGMVRSLAVLEHVREPEKVIAEVCRVVRPGGYVYTEVPFIQHFHAYPNDFQRYTIEGLKQAFAGFEVVDCGVRIGPSSALTAMIGDWLELFTFSNRRWLNDLVRSIPLTLLFPLKYLDYFLVKNPRAHELASGISLLCRKPS